MRVAEAPGRPMTKRPRVQDAREASPSLGADTGGIPRRVLGDHLASLPWSWSGIVGAERSAAEKGR